MLDSGKYGKDIHLKSTDIIVSFYVVLLFTMVPLKPTVEILADKFNKKWLDLFQLYLTTTYFQWNNGFYEQVEGIAMGSTLSPVMANLFMGKIRIRRSLFSTQTTQCMVQIH